MNLAASGRTWEDASSPAALRLTRRYEQAWQEAERAGLRCDPAEFLADSSVAHEIAGARLAVLRADLSLRWEAGDRVGARWYLDRFKDLGEEAAVALIYEEFCLREEAGDEPEPSEFLSRFAGLAEPLRRVLDIHRLIGSASASSTGSPISPVCLSPTTAGAASQVFFPNAGQTIGGFYLVEELGRGAFARVFLANERQLADRPVALKVTRRGSREPQALARLQHTHIVPVHSHRVDPATGLHLLCMPYLGRVTLARVLAEVRQDGDILTGAALVHAIERLIEADEPHAEVQSTCRAALCGRSFSRAIAWWGARLAEALEHAHDRGILHRDIKPSNVLILGDGMPMLLDFNLARESVFEDDGAGAGAEPRGEPTLGGTVDYMAPEHLEALAEGTSNRVDGRADLFGLGVLLFEALMGKKPFQPPRKGQSVVDSLLRAAESRRLDKSAFAPPQVDVPASLEAVIRLCLEPEPEKRYQSATELAADLRAVADDLPLIHAREPLLSRLSRQVRRNRRRLVAAASVLVAVTAILGAYIIFQIDRYERFSEVTNLSEAGTAAMDRGEFKEAQIYFDQAIQQANHSKLDTVRSRIQWETFLDFGGKLRRKIVLLWTPPALDELERTVQFKAQLSKKIATTRGRAQDLLDRSENLRFRLIGLGEDLPGAVGELKDLLEPFFVLTSKDDWTKLDHFWEQLDEKQRTDLRHEVNELLFLWMVRIETAIRESTASAARPRSATGTVSHPATLDQALDVCDRALAFAERTGPWKALRALLEAQKAAGEVATAPAREAGDHAAAAPELLGEPPHVAGRKSPSECFQWGVLNSSLGRRRRAIEWLQRAARLDWSNYWYQFYLAYLEDQAELFEEALGHYNVAVARQPDSPWVLFSRARLYRTKGMWSWALDDFRKARELMGERPESFRVGLELGYLHQALGDFAAARSEYKSIIQESPRSDYTRAARLNLANIDAESGSVDRARAEYESLLAEDPQDQTTRFSRALLELRRGEIKQAEADLDMILGSGPLVAKRHEILATRAVARLLQRRTTEATADAAEAQLLKPSPPYERLWQRSLLAAGRYGELQLDRPEEISLLPVGGAWLESDLRSAAKELSLLARGPRPQATRALLNLAVVLAALGDRQAAARVADQVLELSSLSPRAHLICARVFHHMGERSRALREIELGQVLQSDEPGLLELRAVLRIEAGDAEKAIVDLNRAIAGSPRNFTFLHKAAALVALGNHEGAIHEWTMALRSDPELPSAFLGRARSYVSLRLWDQALADLEQASAWAHNDPGLQLKILSAYARCVVERPEQRERFALLLKRSLRHGWDFLTRTVLPTGFFL